MTYFPQKQETVSVEPGDWVRFYENGRLVVGVVQYVRQDGTDPEYIHVHTDVGTVSAAHVLEVRS